MFIPGAKEVGFNLNPHTKPPINSKKYNHFPREAQTLAFERVNQKPYKQNTSTMYLKQI